MSFRFWKTYCWMEAEVTRPVNAISFASCSRVSPHSTRYTSAHVSSAPWEPSQSPRAVFNGSSLKSLRVMNAGILVGNMKKSPSQYPCSLSHYWLNRHPSVQNVCHVEPKIPSTTFIHANFQVKLHHIVRCFFVIAARLAWMSLERSGESCYSVSFGGFPPTDALRL